MDKNELRKDFVAVDHCEPVRKDTGKWDVYGKNQYCPVIKVTNWWYHREGFPKDNDDYVNAAYKRWGTSKEGKEHWTTETMESLENGRGNAELNTLKQQGGPKKILSFLSYPITLKTRKDILPEDIRLILPSLPRDELTLRYTSTYRAHYKSVHILSK